MNQLTDTFGRKHDYLRISLTERCNLRCFYCMPEEGIPLQPKDHFMRQEEILEIAGKFVDLGVKKIRLTGGEPLVRKDAREIILGLGKLNAELAITTNGILVDRFIDTFKKAGIRWVNVSLDSLQKEKFHKITRRDYFDRVMGNIELLLREGFSVKVNAVLMKGVNDDEIVDFIEWTKDQDIHVRFIEFMPFDGNKWEKNKGVSHPEVLNILKDHYGKSVERMIDKPNDTTENYRIQSFKGTYGLISSVSNPFCGGCNRLRLTADGKLKNCLFSADEGDLLGQLRAGKDILPVIARSVMSKKGARAGIESFEKEGAFKNRSMVAIGG